MGKAWFYNCSHTTSEHHDRSTKEDHNQSQYDDTPTLESNVTSSPAPPWNIKWEEASGENPDDIQREGFYCSLFLYPTDTVDTAGVISILYSSEYEPLNKKKNGSTVIEYLDSCFEYLDCHDTPVAVYPFDKFLDECGSNFLHYRYLLSIPTLLWTPFTSILALVETLFIQCTPLTGLPLLVVNSNLYPLQSVRLM